MSMQEQLSSMADVADRLEYEGAEIIAASVDNIAGPRLHTWGPTLPHHVRMRGTPLAHPMVGYVDGGVTVFWVEEN